MIFITEIEGINEEAYNFVFCPRCKHKLARKPIETKVRVIPLPRKVSIILGTLIIFCKRCKNNYLITTDS